TVPRARQEHPAPPEGFARSDGSGPYDGAGYAEGSAQSAAGPSAAGAADGTGEWDWHLPMVPEQGRGMDGPGAYAPGQGWDAPGAVGTGQWPTPFADGGAADGGAARPDGGP
ncbi:hypothetical protein RKE29_30630, partial [Streptomyces sp. B1866]|nr:hypothetical protein [Streptomyces sp. B1866]